MQTRTGQGSPRNYVEFMRPNTDPAQFREYADFKIRAIRVWAKKLAPDNTTPSDAQILRVCHEAGLLRRKLGSLDECSETELTRMFKWFGQQIFAAGYDSYYAEQQH